MENAMEEAFVALVKKSEAEVARHPKRYKFKLAAFALFGYACIFFILALLIGLTGGMLALALFSTGAFLLLLKNKIIFVILLAIWTLLKALWVRFLPPEGYKLSRTDAPNLFNEIDALVSTLDALKIHEVRVTEEFNAAVTQHPRLGILGWPKNTLLLGKQLLLALSPEEARAVIAHELGHLSGNHSKFSGWIYRVRLSWERVMQAFGDSDSFGASVMRRFFYWYAPKFSAYSFALARQNEYEADEISAKLTSNDIAAKALVNAHVLAPQLDKQYWGTYFKYADTQAEPPYPPYQGLVDFLKSSSIDREQLALTLKEEMQHEAHYADTHPALKHRVAALTNKWVLPDVVQQNAAESWLGESYPTLLAHFDEQWMADNLQPWIDRYEYVQASLKLLKDHEASVKEELDSSQAWQLAEATNEFVSAEASLPYYQQCFTLDASAFGAAYKIGEILANKQDLTALEFLSASFNSHYLVEPAAYLGYDLLMQQKDQQAAEEFWQQALKKMEYHQQILAEVEHLNNNDVMEKAVIDSATTKAFVAQLSQHKHVKAAWIAQKKLTLNSDLRCYVIYLKFSGFFLSYDKQLQRVADNFESEDTVFFVSTKNDSKKIAKKVKKLANRLL